MGDGLCCDACDEKLDKYSLYFSTPGLEEETLHLAVIADECERFPLDYVYTGEDLEKASNWVAYKIRRHIGLETNESEIYVAGIAPSEDLGTFVRQQLEGHISHSVNVFNTVMEYNNPEIKHPEHVEIEWVRANLQTQDVDIMFEVCRMLQKLINSP